MSFVSRLLGRARGSETRAAGLGFVGGYGFGLTGLQASHVTPWQAENLSTVTACVNAIAAGLGTLPATVYAQQGQGRVEAPQHPVARLLRRPNRWQAWTDWLEFTIAQVLLWGNSVSVIEYDGAGRPTALIPVPWRNVNAQLLQGGRMVYDIVQFEAPWGGTGQARRYLDTEVFHLRDRSDDGFVGRSRIARAPEVLESTIGLQRYSSKIWHNMATPKGMVVLPPGVKGDQVRRVESWFQETYVGTEAAGKPLFMPSDTTYTPMSVSPEDAEVLASRQFSVIELCRLFGVPPPIVQDYSNSTFTNASQASTWFATNTLTPWARKVEAEFARSVFSDPSGRLPPRDRPVRPGPRRLRHALDGERRGRGSRYPHRRRGAGAGRLWPAASEAGCAWCGCSRPGRGYGYPRRMTLVLTSAKPAPAPLPPDDAPVLWELWRTATVSAKTGLGKTTIYRLMNESKFPRPRRVGGSVAWLSRDIIVWMSALQVHLTDSQPAE